MLFLLFLLFLVSESLLFVSFFWTSFHSLSSPSFEDFCTGFYVPDPCELSFANTLLLSNAAISLGNAFISLEISSSSWQQESSSLWKLLKRKRKKKRKEKREGYEEDYKENKENEEENSCKLKRREKITKK